MRLGIGHGPRFHLNLFGARCRWPCLQQTTSSISSRSTNSSLLDNDNDTNSWTYIQYANNSNRSSEHNGSTLNDTELISLINEGVVEEAGDNRGSSHSNDEVTSGLPQWLNANDRHTRRDVRTLFPEDGLQDGSGASFGHDLSQVGAVGECQYVNVPLVREQNGECVPFYTAGRRSTSNTSSSSHGSRRLTELFDLEPQLDNVEGNSDWVTGGDHPYGIPSTLLGGVLLNLDNRLRLSSNTEWQNWSDFLTSAQDPPENPWEGARTYSGTYESMLGASSNRSSDASGAASTASNDLNNSLNNENTSNEIPAGELNSEDVGDLLPNLSFPRGRFLHHGGLLHRHMALPPPPSSSSSTRSSGSGSTGRPRQQEWYFYDPRLVSEERTERVTLDTSFRGLRNRCVMSSIIQPPAYDDIVQTDDVTGASGAVEVDPPPPYTEIEPSPETEPPPSYDQSFGHTLAFPTFNIGLPVNPLERRLAASLCMSPLVTSIPMPEPDLLMDVNIDELLDGPLGDREEPNLENNNESGAEATEADAAMEDNDDDDDDLNSSVEMLEHLEDGEGASDSEAENSQFSLQRYPVGFCLGRRPPLRWSRGMAPNRWAPQENWADQ